MFPFQIFHTFCICTQLHKKLIDEDWTHIFLPYSYCILTTTTTTKDLFKNYLYMQAISQCNIPLGGTHFLFNLVIHILCLCGNSLHLISPHILCTLGKFEDSASFSHPRGTIPSEELNYLFLLYWDQKMKAVCLQMK